MSRGRVYLSIETSAKGIRILREERLLILELTWGAEFAVAIDSLPALEHVGDEQLLDVCVTRDGNHIAWPALKLELSVATLVQDAVMQAQIGRRRRPRSGA